MQRAYEASLLIYILLPGVLVNGLFKGYWGRARPDMVAHFGGPAQFTLPFEWTDQCAHNCSFVSGEGAGAAAMVISVALMLFAYGRGRLNVFGWQGGVLAITALLAATAMVLRVALGRHFLSDTIFAVLFVVLGACLLLRLPRYRPLIL